jgi:hypothetical protein
VRLRSLAPGPQRSGIGDDEPEASFERFSAGVGGGEEGASAGADCVVSGGATGAAGGGCSCVHAARAATIIAAATEKVSLAMSSPALQAVCQTRSFTRDRTNRIKRLWAVGVWVALHVRRVARVGRQRSAADSPRASSVCERRFARGNLLVGTIGEQVGSPTWQGNGAGRLRARQRARRRAAIRRAGSPYRRIQRRALTLVPAGRNQQKGQHSSAPNNDRASHQREINLEPERAWRPWGATRRLPW